MNEFDINVEVPMSLTLKATLTPLGVSFVLIDTKHPEVHGDDMGFDNEQPRKLSQQLSELQGMLEILPPTVAGDVHAAIGKQIEAAAQ